MPSVKPSLRSLHLLVATVLASTLTCSLAGCGTDTAPVPPPPSGGSYPGVTVTGKAMAGTQPIIGATIQLYAAGTTGNGSVATPLLTTALTTDATGAFTIPSAYPCPSANSQLYLIASGGKVGSAAVNPAITLATVLGVCNQLTASSQFVINEVTTTATVWALSQFLTASTSLGASATNTRGLANAVATAANLANLTTGASPGATFPATGASPAPRINTLANLLNTCTAATSSDTLRPTLCGRHTRQRRYSHQHLRRGSQSRPQSRHQRRNALHAVHCQHSLHSSPHPGPGRLDALHPLHRRRHEQPHRSWHRLHRQCLGRQLLQCRLPVLSHRQSHLRQWHHRRRSMRFLRSCHRRAK